MAYYDNEINIINDFRDCRDEDICLLNKDSETLLQIIRDEETWHQSNGKADPPPDFYSNAHRLMMEVMRIDDHAYMGDNGKTINPHIRKENKTYKEIQRYLKEHNIAFSGDILVNTVTDLPTEEDHSYDKYTANFQRVLGKHDSSYELYVRNHNDYKLIYFILDESSPYMELDNQDDRLAVAGKTVKARVHLPFLDKSFISVLKNTKADYFVWYMPFKHFNSEEKVVLPQAVIYSKDDLKKIIVQKYKRTLMSSMEI